MFVGCPIVPFVCLFIPLFIQSDILTAIAHQLEQFDKTDSEYSLGPTDDVVILGRSKFRGQEVKVTAEHRGQIL